MPILDASWSGRLRLVGELERPDHWYLTAEDDCAFFGEYTAGGGYGHSTTNHLILNLKKKPETRGTAQWKYKGHAIGDIGQAIAKTLSPGSLAQTTFVPIPPSRPAGDPDYDDRMAQVARAIGPAVDVREVLYTAVGRDPAHVNASHRDPAALKATLSVNSALVAPAPLQVILLDDVLTTGCSFKVCKAMLAEVWPAAKIYGLFVARRVIARPSAEEDFAAVEGF